MKNANKISEEVELLVNTANASVRDSLIKALVDAELVQRADMAKKAYVKLTELKKEIDKLEKPDVKTYDSNLIAVSEAYSEARVKELKKQKDKYTKLDAALGKALSDGDYDSLQKALS